MRVILGPNYLLYKWDDPPSTTVSEQNNATVGGSPGPTHQLRERQKM